MDPYQGDIPTALKANNKVLLVTRGSQFIKAFDPAIYKQKNSKSMSDISTPEHMEASKAATNNQYLPIPKKK